MKHRTIKNKKLIKAALTLFVLAGFGFLVKAPTPCTFQTFVDSSEPVIYANICHEQITSVIRDAIDSAQQSVFLRIYRLSSPEILASLAKQIEANHRVSIHYQNCREINTLQQTPQVVFVEHARAGHKLMHQKALAIDQQYAWLGTANFTNTSFLKDCNVIIGCKSKELCEYIAQDISGPLTIQGQPARYYSLPQDRSLALEALLEQFKKAKKTIQVAMFALTYPPIVQELQIAQQRGVKVEVIIDKEFQPLCVKQLESKHCTFSVFCKTTPNKQHCKMTVIDQNTLIIGSVNWSKNGFCLNSEDMLILEQLTPKQQKKLKQIWSSIRSQSERIYPMKHSSIVPFEKNTNREAA